jgi:uncharacterized protein
LILQCDAGLFKCPAKRVHLYRLEHMITKSTTTQLVRIVLFLSIVAVCYELLAESNEELPAASGTQSVPYTEKHSPLVDAAEAGDWSRVKDLVEQESINAVQPDGMSALHWAVFKNHLPMVKLLTSKNADVNLQTRYHITPLVIACENGFAEIAELLLQAEANVNHELPGGETPLMIASLAGNKSVVEQLIAHKAVVNTTERRGQTAMMWAAAKGNVDAVDALLSAGADLNTTTKTGFTAMFFAARNGHLNVVKQLAEAGVDINLAMQPSSSGGRSPRKGTSALMLAVESGHYELAMWLIQHGANPNDQRSGHTPLHALSWIRKPNRGEGVDGDPSPRGSGNLTDLQFVKAIVAAGADVNLQLKNGKSGKAVLGHKGATPFLLASKTADLPLLELLLVLGADPLIPNSEGCTPLMACAGIGVRAVGEEAGTEPEVINTLEFLIKHGADVNTVDDNRETAMHGAAYRCFPEVVNFLTDQGADAAVWDHKNKSGWTPALIAQGHRPGSFKPSPETVSALQKAMLKSSKSDASQ